MITNESITLPHFTYELSTSVIIMFIIIIIMGIFKCYFSGEHIALLLRKNNNNDVNIELGKTNRLKALCMVQVNT